jgi:hypothetical protein
LTEPIRAMDTDVMNATNDSLPAATATPMLLDELIPEFDATRIEHRVVDATLPEAYEAVLDADFNRAWKESTTVRALFAARSAAEEAVSRLRGRDFSPPAEAPSMRLADLGTHGGGSASDPLPFSRTVRLGEDRPREIAFGMVGRFWSGETAWKEIDASDFAGFHEPGFARIGCNFSLRPYGTRRTLVSYEARTQATDEDSRRQFLRYWKAVSPGVGMVMRSMVAAADPTPAG